MQNNPTKKGDNPPPPENAETADRWSLTVSQQKNERTMYLGGESNPYLKIRNFPFYPLNYQGESTRLGTTKVLNIQ